MKKSIFTSLFLSFIMLLFLSVFIITMNIPNPPMFATSTIWTIVLIFFTFMMFKTGNISKYRSIFFVIYGFAFVLTFITGLLEERGSLALTEEIISSNETPLCPVAIPQLIMPAIFKQVLVFPTKLVGGPHGGFYPVFFMWLLSVIVIGRGWCSWGCFFGGIDEGFSKFLRKIRISTKNINPKWKYLPFAVLIVIVFGTFMAMEPVYCSWLCPLKLVTEYVEVTNLTTYLQAIIFITLGMGLLFILPLLMKKRTQCGLFCPLGAFQSLVGVINPYRVKIDKNKCIECGKCKTACPTFSISDENIKSKKISITCTRCGLCMEQCPQNAINYSLLGVPFSTADRVLSNKFSNQNPSFIRKILISTSRFCEEIFDARTLFVFSALLFGAIISGGMVPQALLRLYNLFTTGSLLIH